MERGAVAAVRWHPEDAAAMVAGASARVAGVGDGVSCFEQVREKKKGPSIMQTDY